MSRSRILVLVLALVVGACTSAPEPASLPATDGPSPAGADTTGEDQVLSAEEGEVEAMLVDAALELVLTSLDPTSGSDGVLDAARYEAVFAQEFRDQVPLEELGAVLEDLRALGPYEPGTEVSRSAVGELVLRATAADGSEIAISLFVTPDGLIEGLLFTPGDPPALETPVSTVQEAMEELATRGILRLSAATVERGECTTDVGVGAAEPAPVGSAIKLYILAAVVDAISDGTLTWDDDLVLSAADQSLPSGVLQDRSTPSLVTVQEAAALMVQVSDNTATDLLLRSVGRPAVEAAQADWGHATPGLNVPFMTTGELFRLKVADPEVQQAWLEGEEATRRQVLDDLADAPLPDVEAFVDQPLRPDELEWFASPEDLCRVLARLLARGDEPGMEPLEEILTTSVGVPDAEELWTRLAFKGGSEPGLLAAVWVVEQQDGPTRALAASLLDPAAPLDEIQGVLLMAAARDLLASD